ncbi:NnrS family protein [Roseovarius sp. 2305UL8-3]|uniref:NnrS family protein n=1 Tax=Roseovarius conchicola TaxID=3121636 RepID=UPI003527E61A
MNTRAMRPSCPVAMLFVTSCQVLDRAVHQTEVDLMKSTLLRVLGEPYRIFFLCAGLYAVLALLVWEAWLGAQAAGSSVLALPFAPPPHLWHAHEMIFGYASAALGGFFLTAVPNWTGSKAVGHVFVWLVVACWLAGRVVMWLSGALPPLAVAVIDLAFLPLLGLKIALMLIKRPKRQNVAFLVFLSLIWVGNLMVHLEWMGLSDDTLYNGLRVGLIGLCLMIAVLGGRVTPAFTRNAMKKAGVVEADWPNSRKPVDMVAMAGMALLLPGLLFGLPDMLVGAVALVAGIAQMVRVLFWRPLWTLNQPILWALHLAMLMLGLGMVLWGLSLFGAGSEVAAIHVLGIGAVGGMTLAVMSRAVLGHTGRALQAPSAVALAYGLIALAAGLRWLATGLGEDWYFPAVLLTGGLWISAFMLYLVALWPALTGPRLTDAS